MANYSIELDCSPGSPRPGDLLPGVLKDTGINLDPDKPVSTFFGNWTWEIPEDQEDLYQEKRDIIKERITKLYHDGAIRYGSW